LDTELRLSFGNAAEDYERGRPEWPDAIADIGGLPPEAEVLDLGAGTGKLTRVLARRFRHVTAVEPDASMRAVLSQVTDCHLLEGSAERIPLGDSSADGVFCGESFHWFDWPVALAEIERVLRPRGVLVLCFNAPNGPSEPPLPDEARAVVERYRRPGTHAGGKIIESGAWRELLDSAESPFEPLREEHLDHVHVQSRDEAVAQLLSISIFAALPADDRAAFAAELRESLPDVTFRTPTRAEVWWTRLR
jgi:ubiquinone/menaquinone biosynthesis C-methylase UbiE